jgi:hypothetical protein
LRGLVSTAQKKDDDLAGLLEVNAITRPMGHSHLAYAGADRLNVARIAKAQPLDA